MQPRLAVLLAFLDRALFAGVFAQWGAYAGLAIMGGELELAFWFGPLVALLMSIPLVLILVEKLRSQDIEPQATLERASSHSLALIVLGAASSGGGAILSSMGLGRAGLSAATLGTALMISEGLVMYAAFRVRSDG